ncbi:MAG: hypothetical protein ABJO52_12745 [Nisaea sp.]|uniref:hypothetical protein n=2 Tax=Nisaea sp. TaxID=2024842 RepID=UPI00329753F6
MMKIDGPSGGLYDDWLRSIKTGEVAAATGSAVEDFSKEIKGEGDFKAEDVEKAVARIEEKLADEGALGGKGELETQFAEFLNRLLVSLQEDDQNAGDMAANSGAGNGGGVASGTAAAPSGGAPGPDEAKVEPSTVTIDGIEVIVSGHSVDDMEGRSLFRTVGDEENLRLNDSYINLESNSEDFVQAVMEVFESRPYEPLPAGSSIYMSISSGALKGEIKPQKIANDHEEKVAQDRKIVTDFFEMVDIERQLKEEYGEDVKLTYSHADQSYIMLTSTDLHYDDLASVEENTVHLLESLGNDQDMLGNVKDILQERGLFT